MTLIHGAQKVDENGVVGEFWLLLDGETIAATGTGAPPRYGGERVDATGRMATPGFIDLHCHGGGAASFEDGPPAITAALAVHRAHGTTRSVISLVSNPVETLCGSLTVVADLVDRDPLVLGSHLEGPFLAAERRGAHDASTLRDPDGAALDLLLASARGTLRQVTLAPERPGAMEAISRLRAAGVGVAVGHTDADHLQARAAFDAGATVLTHAFNAMRGIGHRDPGPVTAALRDPRVTLELILDGTHVHPDVAALACAAAPGRVALVSDAMAAAGAPDGCYRLGPAHVTVSGGVARVREPDGTLGSIAGSTLTLDRALRHAVQGVGLPWVDAVGAVTAVPARVLGLGHRLGLLQEGYAADVVLLSPTEVSAVWAAGRRVR